MKKTTVLFLCLALASLACLITTEPVVIYPADTPAGIIEERDIDSGTVYELPAAIAADRSEVCAVVTADTALHVRKAAKVDSTVIGWLDRGDGVRVLDRANGDWWRIEREGVRGYARSVYLELKSCDEIGGYDD